MDESVVLDGCVDTEGAVVVKPVEEGLSERLRFEFGDRIVRLLESAHCLLAGDVRVPCVGEIVAFCFREAFGEILRGSFIGGGEWRKLSRRVVEARKNLDDSKDWDDGMRSGYLDELLEAINALDRFHREQEGLAVRRLREVLLNRAGRDLLPGQVKRFRDVRKRANRGLRKELSGAEARRLWSDGVGLLVQLFMPPSQRFVEIEALACLESPSAEDVESLVGLLSGPDHVRWFLSKVKTPAWLEALRGSEHLQPFEEQLEWPALRVVNGLLPDHRDEVESWLESMYARYGKVMVEVPWRDPEEVAREERMAVLASDIGTACETREQKPYREPFWAQCLALAALNADPPMPGIVLTAVRDHPTIRQIVLVGVSTVRKIPPSDSLVEEFANMLLGESCWNAWPHTDPVVERLVEGIDKDNAAERTRMLCYKLQPSSYARIPTFFEWNPDGSVAEIANDPPYRGRLFVLTKGLTEAINRAREWLTTRDILDITEAISLPPGLANRLRAWTVATSSDADHELMITEVETAISSQNPTGDHLLLIDRVMRECDQALYVSSWRLSLGTAPDVEYVEQVLAANDLPPVGWVRAWLWVRVLPDEVTAEWGPAWQVLKSEYGQPDRAQYAYRRRRAKRAKSPISARELQALGPVEGTRRIARWRPDPNDWPSVHAGARELGRTLESLVKEHPNDWTADPVGIVTTLRHPTYISHYLRGVAAVASENIPLNELLDVIKLVRTHPWETEVLGTSDSDYDHDWSRAEEASVELIKSLAQTHDGFRDRTEEVWDFLETRTTDCPKTEPRSPVDTRDAYHEAINRSCTRALETVLLLVENEYRRSEQVPARAVSILVHSLLIAGDHGQLHRVILAVNFAFLQHVLSEWTENNLELFFGEQAPAGLGQTTFNMVVHRGKPHLRLLKRYQPMLKQAVRARSPRALSLLMIAMLCKTDGFSPQQNLNFLRQTHKPRHTNGELPIVGNARNPSHANSVSEAGAALARLLAEQNDVAEDHLEIAQEFWEAALEEGSLSLEGFGWFAEVTAMDSKQWADLTLKTMKANEGRIHASTQIAQRIRTMPPSKTTLTILDTLLQGRLHQQLRTEIADYARQHLRSASKWKATPEYRLLQTALQERRVTD